MHTHLSSVSSVVQRCTPSWQLYIVKKEGYPPPLPCPPHIHHPNKQQEYQHSRHLLHQIAPDTQSKEWIYLGGKKPALADESLHFSFSHSPSLIALICSPHHPVSIDIENKRAKLLNIEDKFLHPEEKKLLPTHPEHRLLFLTIHWCIKETLYKFFFPQWKLRFSSLLISLPHFPYSLSESYAIVKIPSSTLLPSPLCVPFLSRDNWVCAYFHYP